MATPRTPSATSPQARVDQLVDKADALEEVDPQAARKYAQRALSQASRIRYVKGVAYAHRRLGTIYWRLGAFEEALLQFQKGFSAARRIRAARVLASCVNGLGITYDRLGDYEAALLCFEHFLTLTSGERNPYAFVVATVNIGHVMEQSGRLNEAIVRYRDALKRLEGSEVAGMPMLRMNLGVCLHLKERHRDSIKWFKEALTGFGDDLPLDAILCRSNMAEAYARVAEYETARDLCRIGLREAKRHKATHLELRMQITASIVERAQKQYKAAIKHGLAALSLCEKCPDSELNKLTHEELSRSYEAIGDTKKALAHYKTFAAIQLSIHEKFGRQNAQRALSTSMRNLVSMLSVRGKKLPLADQYTMWRLSTEDSEHVGDANGEQRPMQRGPALSSRERQVLRLLAQGYSNRVIASDLSISLSTARFHVSSIFNKLGVGKRSEAVAIGIQQGLLNSRSK